MGTSLAHGPRAGLRHADRVPAAVFAVLLVLALLPVLMVDIPAGVDYPNHLARMSILARDGTPAANPYYETAWGFYPNLALDLIVPPLARLIGVETATRLFYLVAQLLVVSGAVAIELAVKRRFEIAGFAALLYLYSFPFAWGFLNFQFAMGLALWGIAGWIAFRRHGLWLRLALHSVMVAMLVVGHLFALGIYGLTLGLLELHAFWARRDLSRLIRTMAVLAAPALVAFALIATLGRVAGGQPTSWLLIFKPLWLFTLNGYSLMLSMILTAALAAVIAVLVWARALRMRSAGRVLLVGYAIAFLLMPFGPAGTAFADMRVPVTAALVLPAFMRLRLPDRRLQLAALATVSGIILVSLGMVASVHATMQRSYAEVIASFAKLKANPRIVVVVRDGMSHPLLDLKWFPMLHAPTLAGHYANGFVNTLFTYAGQQPLVPREPVRHLAGTGNLAYLGALVTIARAGTADAPRGGEADAPGLATWLTDYDAVYVIGVPAPNALPEHLDEVARGAFFTAYTIRPPGGAAR